MFPLAHGPQIHFVFEALAITIGYRWYLRLRRRDAYLSSNENSRFILLAACLLGAAIGNKALFWIEFPQLFTAQGHGLTLLLGGQSIVGGLLGGLLGIEIAKRLIGYRHSTGDLFVFPLLMGIFVGRIGCFLSGLADGTFGDPTTLPWGIDFGDGIPRHPTQLYEMLFIALLGWLLLSWRERLAAESGLLFKVMLSSYLLWRLLVDFIKPIPYAYPGGLSGIQVVALLALMIYLPLTLRQVRRVVRV